MRGFGRSASVTVSVLLLLVACTAPIEPVQPASAASSSAAQPAAKLPLTVAPPVASAATRGTQLAYVADQALWTVELPDGAPIRQIEQGVQGWPRWSPSGNWLSVCVNDACGGRWIAPGDTLVYSDAQGTARRLSLDDGQATALPEAGVVWSNDGRAWLAVRQRMLDTLDEAGAPQRTVSLWRMDAGGAAVELFSPGMPSPYGLCIAGWVGDTVLLWPVANFSASLLADGAPLQALPAAGGAPRTLIPSMLAREDFIAAGPEQRLAVVAGSDRQSWTNKRIVLLDLERGATHDLTPPELAAITPAWSPDGAMIAFVAAADAGALGGGAAARAALAQRRIWTVRADGSAARALTGDASYRDEQPRWTHNGQWIVFVRLDGRDRLSLWRMRPNGQDLTRIVRHLGNNVPDEARWFGFYGSVDWTQFMGGSSGVAAAPSYCCLTTVRSKQAAPRLSHSAIDARLAGTRSGSTATRSYAYGYVRNSKRGGCGRWRLSGLGGRVLSRARRYRCDAV